MGSVWTRRLWRRKLWVRVFETFSSSTYSIQIKHRVNPIREFSKVIFINATNIDLEVLEVIFDSFFSAEFDLPISIFPQIEFVIMSSNKIFNYR
jgi:hypothetical protein